MGAFDFSLFFVSMEIFNESTDCAPYPLWSSTKEYVQGETHMPYQTRATQYTHTEENDQQFGISRFSSPR